MIHSKTVFSVLAGIALVSMLSFAGCTVQRAERVVPGSEATVYTEHGDSDEVRYVDRGEKAEYNYVERQDPKEAVFLKRGEYESRLTPAPEVQRQAEPKPELSAMDSEFLAAVTPADYEAFINNNAPDELAFVAVQMLARPYIEQKDWQGAIDIYSAHALKFSSMTYRFDSIIDLLRATDEGLPVTNLGSGINTGSNEYSPVISTDGKDLYFARDCGVCNGGEDIMVSRNQNGFWGHAKKFGAPVISARHEVPLGISADGNTMALFGNYTDALGRGDIYYIEKTAQGWTELQHYPEPLNSEYFESNAQYTSDGKAILFVSERPGGVGDLHRKDDFFHGGYNGNTDIYVYLTDGNGGGRVVNLGTTINTPYSEYTPFLHPDGRTLYFSSDGHYGLGGLDVFKTTRLDDSWTSWSAPVNLGKEVNGPYNDWGYQFSTPGNVAYFSVNNRVGGHGGNDIYMIGTPAFAKPAGVITVSGVVTDPAGNFLEADLVWNNIDKQQEVGRLKSNPQTGEYFIALPSGGKYGYFAEKDGYIGQSEHFDLQEDLGFKEFILDIILYPVEKPVVIPPTTPVVVEQTEPVVREIPIRLNNIFFDFNKWDLKPESNMELDRWVKLLVDKGHLNAEIHGHTDSVGTDEYNLKLSVKRAAAVYNYLVSKGVPKASLTSKGFGESKPVATNDTDAGRQENRRVEIKLINTAVDAR